MNLASALRNPRRALVAATMIVTLAAIPASAGMVYLEFSNNGLEALGPDFQYEGWLLVDGAPVSTGTFRIDDSGAAVPDRFAVSIDGDATTFVLTVEPVPDMDPAPSHTHILAGDFSSGVAVLTAGDSHALGDDFTSASGPYILNAPSGGGVLADYYNGIWWLDPSAGPGPTLDLPTLPDGWVYEGWVVGPDGPMSTGRFTEASGDDSDAGGITAGPYATPPFPGQDLVNPLTDLTSGFAAVISIEPEPDNSPNPFTFKPLVDASIDDPGAGGVAQDMMNRAGDFPTASVIMSAAAPTTETAHVMLDLQNLADLGPDYAYEGWLIVDGSPVSTGVFTVSGGVPSRRYFPTEVSSLDAISAFVLTIEPVPDADPAPSHVHFLAGDFVDGLASLGIGHAAAIGTDFSDASGSYILNAPSSDGAAPYTHGIWWLDPSAGPGPTLNLPTLPDGWMYEGWVVGPDGPISTGRFTMASGQDSDGAGASGGSSAFPPFPGQDFVNPGIDLTSGYKTVITVEPEPDTSPDPFVLKPLADPVIDDVGAGVLQPMHSNPIPLPSGTAVLADPQTILAGASTIGVGGAMWYTDLDIANDGLESANVVIQLLTTNQANPDPASKMVTLPAGGAMRYDDVFSDLFDTTGSGAVRVLADRPGVLTTSRTYAVGADGTYGQGLPAFRMADAIRYGETGRLLGLSKGDVFRSNIGFVNAGNGTIVVLVELFDNSGALVDTKTVTLQAAEHLQLNGVYPSNVEVGWARVSTSTPGGAFWAYASVVDNGVNDPTFIVAR